MKELVRCKYNKITTTSLIVAKHFGKRHIDVMRIIDKFEDNEFKGGNFSTLNLEYRGQAFTAYEITQDGFLFLAMNLQGKKANLWKQDFIKAFRNMETALIKSQTNKSDIQWNVSRALGKSARKDETDAIQRFVEYATQQGSKSAKFYYKHITNATYKALGLLAQKHPKLRDQMDVYETAQLILAEKRAADSLDRFMDMEVPYKKIYELVKDELLSYSKAMKGDAIEFTTKTVTEG